MQYVLAKKTIKGVRNLMTLLREEGFGILQGLDNISDDERIIGICVDLKDKKCFRLNITCMAAWCGGTRKPLYAEEAVDNFERLIVKKDTQLYLQLIEEKSKEYDRPFGVLLKMTK